MRKHQRVYELENRVKVGVMSEVARNTGSKMRIR